MNNDRRERRHAKGYRRILIVRLDRIGDVLLSTPVIRAARKAYPDSHLAFMVRPYARAVVLGNPDLDEVIVYDKAMGLAGTVKFIRFLKSRKFDLAIILHPTSRTHLVTFLARIPERIGYDRKLGALLTKRVPHTKHLGLKHEIDYALDLAKYAGIDPQGRALHMPISDEAERKVAQLFSERGIAAGDAAIAIHPGASCRSKRWDPQRFAVIADRLAVRYGAKIILIGGPDDRAYADSVAAAMKSPCVNLAGETSVSDAASVVKRARLFISNDSGPVHIACAVGTPVIALFGRGDRGLSPKRWGPSNKGDIALHKDVGCVACLAHNCELGFKCLEAITVDDVFAAADTILKR